MESRATALFVTQDDRIQAERGTNDALELRRSGEQQMLANDLEIAILAPRSTIGADASWVACSGPWNSSPSYSNPNLGSRIPQSRKYRASPDSSSNGYLRLNRREAGVQVAQAHEGLHG